MVKIKNQTTTCETGKRDAYQSILNSSPKDIMQIVKNQLIPKCFGRFNFGQKVFVFCQRFKNFSQIRSKISVATFKD